MADTTELATRPEGLPVHLSAPGGVQVSQEARTIAGLVVPYGPAGQTAAGQLTFASGSLRWSEPRRVKLLLEHDQRSPVGYATALEDRPEGLWATFHLPEGDAGDRALAEAQAGLRDGLSVGSQLDDAVSHKLRRAQVQGGSVAATGQLREVSLVSVPAFDDARVASVAAAAGLVVSAWTDDPQDSHPGPVAAPGGPQSVTDTPTQQEAPPMTEQPTQDDQAVSLGTAPELGGPEARVSVYGQDGPQSTVPVMRAAAGSALVTASEPIYRFDGTGPSLMADAAAATNGDGEARGRLARFNQELSGRNQGTELALATALSTAAVLTRPGAPDAFLPTTPRAPLALAIDAGRVLAPLSTQVNITNATPFQVPTVGRFTGVGDHVEGTPHVAEGTLTLGDETVIPRAVSGAYRVSRELIDSSNPVIDQLALAKMVEDYQRATESRIVAALVAADALAEDGAGTVMALRRSLLAAMGNSDVPVDAVVAGTTFMSSLAADVDGMERPYLATQPINSPAAGTPRAGFTGTTIDGVTLYRSVRVAADEAWVIRKSALMFAESPIQTFRLEQPEGPGIVKLAVWGYAAAQVLDIDGVTRLAV